MDVKVSLRGLEPGLMMNSLGRYGADIPDQVKKSGIKTLRNWYETDPTAAKAWEAETGSYRSEDGVLCIPRDVLWACFVRACSGYKVKVGGKNMTANNVFPSVLNFSPHEVHLYDDKGKPITKIESIETKFVNVPPGPRGVKVPKSWAVIFPWNAEFIITAEDTCTSDHLTVAQIIMEHAGKYMGLMDGRPQLKRFNYGRFDVVGWEVMKETGKSKPKAKRK